MKVILHMRTPQALAHTRCRTIEVFYILWSSFCIRQSKTFSLCVDVSGWRCGLRLERFPEFLDLLCFMIRDRGRKVPSRCSEPTLALMLFGHGSALPNATDMMDTPRFFVGLCPKPLVPKNLQSFFAWSLKKQFRQNLDAENRTRTK
jgi:hypothetical protein